MEKKNRNTFWIQGVRRPWKGLRKAFGSQNPSNKLLIEGKQVAEKEEGDLRANGRRINILVKGTASCTLLLSTYLSTHVGKLR